MTSLLGQWGGQCEAYTRHILAAGECARLEPHEAAAVQIPERATGTFIST
jgi:hypothetical protein